MSLEAPDPEKLQRKSQRSVVVLLLGALAMFGFAFALVPLYDVFCDITGLNGKTSNQQAKASQQIDFSRLVTVEFVAYTDPDLSWEFRPQIERLTVHPGETYTIDYLAKNNSLWPQTGQAVPSVTPGLAAQYLNKIECFCFNRQPLDAGENANLPLVFYVDPAIPKDMSTLTLAYTLFKAKDKAVTP